MLTSTARDLYVKEVDKNGHSSVRCHRVWDADRFMASAAEHAKKEGSKLSVITEREYRATKGWAQ